MKRLIFIGGPMGIGKTTIGRALVKNELANAVFLDGDWCCDLSPFIVNDENKQMVVRNIQFLLNSFIENSKIENIVFVWVMHQQAIIYRITAGLIDDYHFVSISLVATPAALRKRFNKDVTKGIRENQAVNGAVARLQLYAAVNSQKIDVTNQTVFQTVAEIMKLL